MKDAIGWQTELTPSVSRIADAVVRVWPEHERFLEKRFAGVDQVAAEFDEEIGRSILKLSGHELETLVMDYRWMGEEFLREEMYFRRTGRYRRTSLEETIRDVYSNAVYMKRYMNGLLLSQLLWTNHASTARYFCQTFLRQNSDQYSHLEIGPGHGLLLAMAAKDERCTSVTGWDISRASLEATRECIAKLGIASSKCCLEERWLGRLSENLPIFDSIVLSHVLEHLEDPATALIDLIPLLSEGGRVLIVVPTNSPTPDHIFLFRHPDDVRELVEGCGFRVNDLGCYPATGYDLERAVRKSLPMSVAIVASPA